MKKNYLCLLIFLLFAGIIQAQIVPDFTQVAPICSGATLEPLPTTSNNFIAGSWAPAVVNTATTTYTFTPDTGQNATIVTMTIVVNKKPILTFTANPFPICTGSSSVLSANSNNITPTLTIGSQTLNILPAFFGTPLTAALAGSIVNSPNNGCGAVSPYTAGQFTGKIVLIERGVCAFNEKALNAQNAGAIGVIIYNRVLIPMSSPPAFNGDIFAPGGANPLVTIPVYGISRADGLAIIAALTAAAPALELPITLAPAPVLTYLWSTGATTQTINSGVLNADTPFTVTVTVQPTGCFTTTTVNAAVTPNIVPTFTQIAAFCAGTTAPVLPAASTNTVPLAGIWSPAVVDNMMSGVYTFTPTPVVGQCLVTTTMSINVTPNTTDIQTISECGTSYTWAANNVIYNAGGTYNFQDGCVARTLNLTLTPASDVVTTATACGTYTWANNNQTYTQTGIYTGTTTNCITQKLNLTITPIVNPSFTQVAPICTGATLEPLPTTSDNFISGTWAPAVLNTATTTYTFTPDNGQCASIATMTIIVNAKPILTFTANPFPICTGSSSVLSANSNNITPTLTIGSQTLNILPAFFGTPLTAALAGSIVNSPNNGCGAVSPYTAGQFTGKIVLIERGVCAFNEKALNAQNAGAIGVIIYNRVLIPMSSPPAFNGDIFAPGGANPLVTIPVYGISRADGLAIIAALTAAAPALELPITLAPAPVLTYLWSTGATTQTINSGVLNADTPFTVTVTVQPTGCFTTTTVNAAVTPNIVPTFTQIAAFCAGTTAPVLPAASTNTVPLAGIWSPAIVDNMMSGVYTFTPTPVVGQCLANTTMAVTVNAPTTVTGSATQNFLVTDTLASIVVTPSAVVWYASSANAISGTSMLLNTQVLTNGATYYAVSTVNNCPSQPFAVTVGTTLSTSDFDANTRLSVYPNPFNDVLNISISSNATIEIFDIVGKSIQNQTIENGLSQIDLGNLASGVYMMKVVNENNQAKTVRVVKK